MPEEQKEIQRIDIGDLTENVTAALQRAKGELDRLRSEGSLYGLSSNRHRCVNSGAHFPSTSAWKQKVSSDPLELLCPSLQPEMAGSVAFGVVRGTAEKPVFVDLREAMICSKTSGKR
jgi:hypothetical protein